MKKNGFTLIELLAVVTILGIIAVISVQTYSALYDRNKKRQYEYMEEIIKKAAELQFESREYLMKHNDCLVTTYQSLVDKGYIKMNTTCEGNDASCVKKSDINCEGKIILRKKGNRYVYDMSLLECTNSKGEILKDSSYANITTCKSVG